MSAQLLLPLVATFAARFPRAAAQGTNAVCESGFDWMSNSKGQTPCLVSSYLFTPCSAPALSWVYPLSPGYHYNTPLNTPMSATPCRCNTVLFSTIAACATCQGQEDYIVPWSTYSQNCSTVFIQKFPESIPAGTAVPAWAYLDITPNNTFNPAAARAMAEQNIPESTAVNQPTSPTNVPTSPPAQTSGSNGSPITDNDNNNTGAKKSTNVGAIVGGVVGGAVGLLLIGLVIFFFLRHRRNARNDRPTGPLDLTAGGAYGQHPPYVEKSPTQQVVQPLVSDVQSPRLYDPNDPSTFPSQDPYATSAQGSSGYPTMAHVGSGDPFTNTGNYQTSVGTNQNPTYRGAPEL